MAGFVAHRNEIGIKPTSTSCTVPDNPKAKLMYYLKCVSSVLQLDNHNLNRLTNYSQYYNLDDEDTDALLTLVCLFKPDELIGKVFFPSEDCDGSSNKIYELSSLSTTLAVADSIVIGGQRKRVAKIMLYKRVWMQNYYYNPMRSFQNRLSRLARGLPGREPSPPRYVSYSSSNQSSQSCTIL